MARKDMRRGAIYIHDKWTMDSAFKFISENRVACMAVDTLIRKAKSIRNYLAYQMNANILILPSISTNNQ